MMRCRCVAVRLFLLFLCSCLLPCPRCFLADGAALQAEVDIVALFFTTTGFRNTTPVTLTNICSEWPLMIICISNRVSSFYFGSANLFGTLPTGLSGLVFLNLLTVSDNQLTGSIPSDLCRSGKMMNVQMGGNLFSGSLPPELSNCTLMRTFNVSYNNLSGTIPAAYSAWGASISTFEVTSNLLTGTLPPEFSSWTMVFYFLVNSNQLSGTLPPEYSSMEAVAHFDVDTNRFTGTLPQVYQQLHALEAFSCNNNFLSGTLPSAFASWVQVSFFQVDSNFLTGTLPREYAAWRQIHYFDVGNNSFTGSLPPEYANWTQITSFYVSNNFLSGTLPPQYGNGWKGINLMAIQNNNISGSLPAEYSALVTMSAFNVALNLMSGTLPPQYQAWSKMSKLSLYGNAFAGSIPLSWGTGMTRLGALLAFNNMLSGTIPLMNSPLLITLAISFNDFSGTLPAASSWPSLTTLDVQNNSKLVGPIFSPSTMPFLISSCGTELCLSSPDFFLVQVCLPSGAIAATIMTTDSTAILTLARTYSYSTESCAAATTLVPTLSPPPSSSSLAAVNQSTASDYQKTTVGAVATTAVLGATLAAVDSADAQMLVSVLGSPCVCSTTLPVQQREGSVLLLALSPFSPLGSAWAAIGNSLLCLMLVGSHAALAILPARHRCGRRSTTRCLTKAPHCNTLLGRFLHDSIKCERRRLFARLRFPNLSVALLMLLLPGVVRALASVAGVVSSQSQSSDSLEIAAFPIGVVFALFVGYVIEVLTYRHVDAEASKSSPLSQRGNATLRFSLHSPPLLVSKIVPAAVSAVALPRGVWEPFRSRVSYGGVVSAYVSEWRRAWIVLPLANVIVQILNGISGGDAVCDALQTVTLCVLAGVCAFIAYARPHRALLASYLVCASLVLTMVTALLGLLCRHGAVSPDAVSGFGVFASVAMFVFKLYHVLMPIAERRLMGRNEDSGAFTDENATLALPVQMRHQSDALRELLEMAIAVVRDRTLE
ncbi:GP46-like surface antigen, putative [Bodo saltans]|uniref:GP46-like surface antigen, putative n=1 Tax=Bodo saltans TaxID=75058 RepID=A0A0S4IQA7_BODSA|nr:GP46-like surface antigen, putative [Bodo saltans]|eukprot:CUF20716.1 GP46-like surface antigen, putative [Bodo saltans]